MIADERLRALGHAHIQVDDEGAHIGDDGITHHTVGAQVLLHRAVEQQDHHAGAQLGDAVGQADGQQPPVHMGVKPELPQAEGTLFAKEMDQIHHAGQKLGQSGGHRRAEYAHVQPEDGDIVHDAVGKAAGGDRDDGHPGIAVGLDQYLQVIRDDEAGAERSQAQQIILYIIHGHRVGAQQPGKGPPQKCHRHRDQQAQPQQHRKVLGKQGVGLPPLVLGQEDGDDGGGPHREHHRDGKQGIGKGDGQVDGAHGVFIDAQRHQQAVHHGVQGKHHERRRRGRYELDKIRAQALSFQLQINKSFLCPPAAACSGRAADRPGGTG